MIDFEKYSKEIVTLHPEFTEEEIFELCEEYVSRFNRKTKEESKIRSLEKWLKKEFMWNTSPQTPLLEGEGLNNTSPLLQGEVG